MSFDKFLQEVMDMGVEIKQQVYCQPNGRKLQSIQAGRLIRSRVPSLAEALKFRDGYYSLVFSVETAKELANALVPLGYELYTKTAEDRIAIITPCVCEDTRANMFSVKDGTNTFQYGMCHACETVWKIGENLCLEGMSCEDADKLTEGYIKDWSNGDLEKPEHSYYDGMQWASDNGYDWWPENQECCGCAHKTFPDTDKLEDWQLQVCPSKCAIGEMPGGCKHHTDPNFDMTETEALEHAHSNQINKEEK
jgi:hypothetical protein